MADKVNSPDPDSVTRTNTEIETRGATTPAKPTTPPEDTLRTNTEIETRSATGEQGNPNRPAEQPDTPRSS